MKKNSGLFGRYLSPNITVNTSGMKDYFDLFLSWIMWSKDNLISLSSLYELTRFLNNSSLLYLLMNDICSGVNELIHLFT